MVSWSIHNQAGKRAEGRGVTECFTAQAVSWQPKNWEAPQLAVLRTLAGLNCEAREKTAPAVSVRSEAQVAARIPESWGVVLYSRGYCVTAMPSA